ncbi:transcriptional regulator PpsR [Paracraurococcus lichenis]|uniref:Transcriptional regulator PpsR n=1 Tax=Paracraurococcus lichenis TaxID=3064888 RepID=A0ABT9E1C0_9PROT|nr:transcriptional regulator PpsR [Paracraurococcus sp. LOR1-02]MDO9709958.1 transcriptional regulator PpsR [Paracraurococcus sp. LOR1-02]
MSRVTIAQPDVTLTLDMDGVIRGVALSEAMTGEAVQDWVGRPWAETVGTVGVDRVRSMVNDARTAGVSAFHQLTQRFPSGLEVPMEYTTVRLGGQSGLVAVGKNLQAVAELQSRLLAAQQAREQDYWKLREIETRSRLLFDASSEAVLLVRADTLRVVEANPAAIRSLGIAPGWEVLKEVAPRDQETVETMLLRARRLGRVPGIMVRMGPEQAPWTMKATLMASDPAPVFLLQLAPVGLAPDPVPPEAVQLEEIIEQIPDAFLLLDRQGVIRRANRAFLDLAQAGAPSQVIGESLDRWLARPGATLAVLLGQLQQHGSVRLFGTSLTGEMGAEAEVEISAVLGTGAAADSVAVVIRDVSRRLAPAPSDDPLRLALSDITGQVGRTPLPALVRDTAAVIERHCIDIALQLANGRRTAAAELLGLSRQSLYMKLNRYGLDAESETGRDGDG